MRKGEKERRKARDFSAEITDKIIERATLPDEIKLAEILPAEREDNFLKTMRKPDWHR
jgi:hypothetical protein